MRKKVRVISLTADDLYELAGTLTIIIKLSGVLCCVQLLKSFQRAK